MTDKPETPDQSDITENVSQKPTNQTALEALKACRDQFAFYAEEHRKAGKVEKAETNERFRDLADAALSQPVQPLKAGEGWKKELWSIGEKLRTLATAQHDIAQEGERAGYTDKHLAAHRHGNALDEIASDLDDIARDAMLAAAPPAPSETGDKT